MCFGFFSGTAKNRLSYGPYTSFLQNIRVRRLRFIPRLGIIWVKKEVGDAVETSPVKRTGRRYSDPGSSCLI